MVVAGGDSSHGLLDDTLVSVILLNALVYELFMNSNFVPYSEMCIMNT